jgi:hypothetical protein
MTRRWPVLLGLLGAISLAALGCGNDAQPPKDAGGDVRPQDGAPDRAPDSVVDQAGDRAPDQAGDGLDGRDGGPDGGDGGDTRDGGDAGVLTAVQSFTVTALISLTPRAGMPTGGPPVPPITQDLVLRLDPVARQLIVAPTGNAVKVDLRARSGGGFETAASFPLGFAVPSSCGGSGTVDALRLDVSPEQLTAQGQGQATVVYGDVAVSYDVTISMTGLRDVVGPTLGPDRTGVDPLADLYLSASEPLAATAAARLVLGSERQELMVDRAAGLPVRFQRRGGPALRYGTTYQVEVDGWRDLADNAGRALPSIATLPPPDLALEDGFESAGTSLGGAKVVESPTYPAISGKKSVLITPAYFTGWPSLRFTARLARMANDKVVRVTLRPVLPYDSTAGTYGIVLRIAVPGGAIVESKLPAAETVTTRLEAMQPERGALFLGAARTVEIPLPPAAESAQEIVFDLLTQSTGSCGLVAPTTGYLIDDLRID